MKSLENPMISIIVPIYKVEQYIEKCLASFLAEPDFALHCELILVDDESSLIQLAEGALCCGHAHSWSSRRNYFLELYDSLKRYPG
jgi:cellulose synthase/poly-beta-1,6-N-acetylglucosamine synthase-like glycosyltransferase